MTIFVGVGAPPSPGPMSGGKVYAYNALDTTAATVAPANVNRKQIVFHNPGTIDVYVAPALAYASETATSPTALSPTTSALGGCFLVYANGATLTITGECQGAWQAFSASGSGNALTVMDSNS